MTVSVARAAVLQPRPHAYWAIAEPSSCATLPKLNASLPFAPKRFGPIWSVPMHGAIASTPRLIVSWTTGAAKSTSHVVKMTFAPPLSSLSAQAFATAGLLPCVSQVLICSWRPSTPPFAFQYATRSFAAARAGPSNGAIAPLLSNAQPIVIGDADFAFVCAAAVAARTTPVNATTTRVSPTRELGLLISTPSLSAAAVRRARACLTSTAVVIAARTGAAPPGDPPTRLTSDQGFGTVRTMSHVEELPNEGRMRHRTMAEYALEQLRESIILGELPAGTPLRLDDLARSLGMSISPIREAVRQLEALGLAKHVPHQGARVLDFDVDELRDLFQVRLSLESLAVRRAAERFTEQDAVTARGQLVRFDETRGAGVDHDPDAAADALYQHLELASVIFETELGGKGIFERIT